MQNKSEVQSHPLLLKSLKVLLFVTFCLISLGGAVRAMNAGLACPDWPLCFGKVIPEYDLRVYYEFIHRTIAGFVGLGTFVLAFFILKKETFSKAAKNTILFSLVILISQIVLGGLTVLKLLHFGVVTAHLAFGMLFFSSLLWLHFVIRDQESEVAMKPMPTGFFGVLVFAAFVVFSQILLGGLVSSQYAGVACPDFPLCNGEIIPPMIGDVGIHMTHRLGAYFTVITLLSVYRMIRKFKGQPWVSPELYQLGGWVTVLVLAQVAVGVINVVFRVPPVITVLHLAIAAGILGCILRMFYLGLRESSFAFVRSLMIAPVREPKEFVTGEALAQGSNQG